MMMMMMVMMMMMMMMTTMYFCATHGPGGPGGPGTIEPGPGRGRGGYNAESFKVFSGPGACLFLPTARATSATKSYQ